MSELAIVCCRVFSLSLSACTSLSAHLMVFSDFHSQSLSITPNFGECVCAFHVAEIVVFSPVHFNVGALFVPFSVRLYFHFSYSFTQLPEIQRSSTHFSCIECTYATARSTKTIKPFIYFVPKKEQMQKERNGCKIQRYHKVPFISDLFQLPIFNSALFPPHQSSLPFPCVSRSLQCVHIYFYSSTMI